MIIISHFLQEPSGCFMLVRAFFGVRFVCASVLSFHPPLPICQRAKQPWLNAELQPESAQLLEISLRLEATKNSPDNRILACLELKLELKWLWDPTGSSVLNPFQALEFCGFGLAYLVGLFWASPCWGHGGGHCSRRTLVGDAGSWTVGFS